MDALNSKFTCNLTAFCTLTSAGEYQLKPGRGKKAVLAFVTISNVLIEATEENPPTFLAESIEKLGEEEANDAPEHLRRMIHFAALAADQQGSKWKKGCAWTEELNPANASKCRRLGRSPTDEPLDMYEPSA